MPDSRRLTAFFGLAELSSEDRATSAREAEESLKDGDVLFAVTSRCQDLEEKKRGTSRLIVRETEGKPREFAARLFREGEWDELVLKDAPAPAPPSRPRTASVAPVRTNVPAPAQGRHKGFFLGGQPQTRRRPSRAVQVQPPAPATGFRYTAPQGRRGHDVVPTRPDFSLFLRRFLDSDELIKFPDSSPVRVVVLCHNRAELSLECFRRLSGRVALTVVDNASGDETGDVLGRLRGAKIINNATNLHFVEGANQGAEHTPEETLLFLNNDAFVVGDAIEVARRSLLRYNAGVVGGMIINGKGELQEAGSIVWKSGHCDGYGRGQNPDQAAYGFVREVDYVSGCFLMTPTALFEGMGGFDRDYRPAYYEDADYCMRVWDNGLPVIYEPGAAVVHYEGSSSPNRDIPNRLQKAHRPVFQQKHQAALEASHKPLGTPVHTARSRSKPTLLLIDDRVPSPKLGSGFPRTVALANACHALGFNTTMFGVQPHRMPRPESGVHPAVEFAYGPDLRGFLGSRKGFYNGVIISRPHNMRKLGSQLVEEFGSRGAPIIYDAEAVFAVRDQLRAKVEKNQNIRPDAVNEEIELAKNAQAVTCVSNREKALFEGKGHRAFVVGHAVEMLEGAASYERRTGVVFCGFVDRGSPNEAALLWYASHVLPHVSSPLKIVGRVLSERVKQAFGPASFLGEVSEAELVAALAGARVFVAPHQWAGGIPLKVLTAAACGTPAVVTTLLGEQLGWNTEALSIASNGSEFVAHVNELLQSESSWTSQQATAIAMMREFHSPEAFTRQLSRALSDNGLL